MKTEPSSRLPSGTKVRTNPNLLASDDFFADLRFSKVELLRASKVMERRRENTEGWIEADVVGFPGQLYWVAHVPDAAVPYSEEVVAPYSWAEFEILQEVEPDLRRPYAEWSFVVEAKDARETTHGTEYTLKLAARRGRDDLEMPELRVGKDQFKAVSVGDAVSVIASWRCPRCIGVGGAYMGQTITCCDQIGQAGHRGSGRRINGAKWTCPHNCACHER